MCLWCYHFAIVDYPLFCGRIQFYCNAMTSKLMITHYFVDYNKTHMHCDTVTSKMMIDHYFVDRFFVLPLFRGSNSTNAVWRASRNARIFRRTFSWALLILFCDRIHMHCDAVTSKMMIDHYFVDRFSCFALFRGPNSTNAMRRAHEIVWLHENTIQQMGPICKDFFPKQTVGTTQFFQKKYS